MAVSREFIDQQLFVTDDDVEFLAWASRNRRSDTQRAREARARLYAEYEKDITSANTKQENENNANYR
jgi:hypothetical protein